MNFFLFISIVKGGIFVDRIEDCPKLSPSNKEPESVYDLRPCDIKSVMAIGDGIHSGFGANPNKPKTGKNILFEDVGGSFFSGGDSGRKTFANFLRRYNPFLIGMSRGRKPFFMCNGDWCNYERSSYSPNQNIFNAAVTGCSSADLGKQLNYLRDTVKKRDSKLLEEWKIINLLIGETDLCKKSCFNPGEGLGSSSYFEKMLRKNLLRIQVIFPKKTLVALNLLPEISIHQWYLELHPRCQSRIPFVSKTCPCINSPEIYKKTSKEFNLVVLKLQKEFNEKKIKDFAITCSPMLKDTVNRGNIKNDRSIFSSKDDCFHPSLKAHQCMAVSMWNGLLNKEARLTNIDVSERIICPSEEDRFII